MIQDKTDIDRKIDALMERDSTTGGMSAAMIEGYRLWDNELNRVYRALSTKLPAPQWKDLQKEQRAWIVKRDAKFKLIDRKYATQGSMGQVDRRSDRMEFVRQRAVELRRLLSLRTPN